MRNHQNSAAGRSRDIGLRGAGKGDAPRSCFSKEFFNNFSKIVFTGVDGFERKGRRMVKRYGHLTTPQAGEGDGVCEGGGLLTL